MRNRFILIVVSFFLAHNVFAFSRDVCDALEELKLEFAKEEKDSLKIISYLKKYKLKKYESEYCYVEIVSKIATYFSEKGAFEEALALQLPLTEEFIHWKKEHILEHLRIYFRLSEIYARANKIEKEIEYLDFVIDNLPEEYDKAFTHDKTMPVIIGNRYMVHGQAKKALPIYLLFDKYPIEGDFSWNAWRLNDVALAYHNLGSNFKAIQYFQKAADLISLHNGKGDESYIQFRIMQVGPLNTIQNGAESLELLLDVGEIVKEHHPDNTYLDMMIKTFLASVYGNLGQHENALEYYNLIIPFWENKKPIYNYLVSVIGKSLSLTMLQQTEEAQVQLKLSQDIIETYEEVDLKSTTTYLFYINIALQQYLSIGELEKVLPLVNEGKRLCADLGIVDGKEYSDLLGMEARYFLLKGEQALALNSYKNAQVAFTESKISDNYIIAGFEQLGIYHKQGDHAKIIESAEEIDALYQKWFNTYYVYLGELDQYSTLKSWRWKFDLLQSVAAQNEDNELLKNIGYANVLLQKESRLGFKKYRIEELRNSKDKELQSYFKEWISLNKYIVQQLSLPQDKRAMGYEQEKERLDVVERILSSKSAGFNQLEQIYDASAILESLKEGEVLIDFVKFRGYDCHLNKPCKTQYAAYILKKGQSAPEVILYEDLDNLIELKYRRNLYSWNKKAGKTNLNELIIEPLKEYLAEVNTIYIVPTGVLNRINFGAIPFNELEIISDRFLVKQLGTSKGLLRAEKLDYLENDALLLGGISYELEGGDMLEQKEVSEDYLEFTEAVRGIRNGVWDQLPHTNTEIENISKLLNKEGYKVNVSAELKATEDQFKTLGVSKESPRILHLATHGYFFPDAQSGAKTGFQSSSHPLIRSGLILAGANHVWQGNMPVEGKEDGILTAYEISQMDLSNTELVVLSACETGLGDIEGNEGVYGLQRAFKMAGVKYVMMSLWSVQDKQTKEFMELFYKEWLDNEKSILEAHQATQNAMRQRYAKPFNPNLWAGFVLVE